MKNDYLKSFLEGKNIKFILKSKIQDKKKKAVYDKIEKSSISLFFLPNEKIQSVEFIHYYEFCQKIKSFVIFVTLEEIKFNSNYPELNKLNTFDKNCFKEEILINQFTSSIFKILNREPIPNSANLSVDCFEKSVLHTRK